MLLLVQLDCSEYGKALRAIDKKLSFLTRVHTYITQNKLTHHTAGYPKALHGIWLMQLPANSGGRLHHDLQKILTVQDG